MSFAQRREKLRELMSARSLDAMLVSYASNRYYLSGFELHDVQLNESAGSLVITRDGRDYLCTDARYTDAAKAIWPENDIYIYSGSIPQALRRLLACCGSRIGFESGSVSAAFAKELSEGLTLEPCDGMVEELRLIKEPEEIASLEKSFAVNHAMLKWIKGEIREGMTEAEVSWMIERYFREHGASELAFPSIVAFGENGALPHAIPGEKKLKENMSVLLDVGCRVDTYCSDQTRTF
ncbi:MAG: Xaa-Pro peptidase family protein, partial [Desulfovibrio sp.]